jgi:hypothetical protein
MSKQAVISLEEAQRILKERGVKVRTRTVKSLQFYIKCPDPQCPHHTVDGAFKGTVINWVVLNAGAHLKGAAARKQKAKQLKEQKELLMGGNAS